MSKYVVLLAFLLAVTSALRAPAESTSTPPSGASGPTEPPLPVLLRLIGTGERLDGSPSGGVSASVELSSSEFREVSLRTDAQGCLAASADGPGRSAAAAGLTWTLAARVVTATEDSATVDVRWTRRQTGGGAGTAPLFEESRRVVLHQGGSYPLDILRNADAAQERCSRATVLLGFELIDTAAVAAALLRYDLWLLHRAAAGGQATDHVQASGRQGQQVTYIFAPVHHAWDGRLLPTPRSDGIETEVSGTLRGRVRADGSVVLGLQTWRSVAPAGGSGGLGNGGMKELTVQPGETIEVTLPPVTGRVGTQDVSSLFRGQSTSIRITTTRLR